MKLLIAEPSSSTRLLIKLALGADNEIQWVETLAQARVALASTRFDGVVAALKLLDGSALELLGHTPETAIVLLSDESDPVGCAQALERGADDFVSAPIHAPELRARVRARVQSCQRALPRVQSGGLELDLASRAVRLNGEELELTGREFGILSYLMRHENQVVARETLIAAVWGPTVHVMDRTVSTHIYTLRKKLGPVAAALIRAETGAGYRFTREISPSAAPLVQLA